MAYHVNQRDIEFNLFEWLKMGADNFSVFAEQNEELYRMVLGECKKFAEKEMAPLNQVGDRDYARLENGKALAPKGFKEVYQKYAENGFLTMDVDVEHGGQGLPLLLMVASMEYFIGANLSLFMYPGLTRGAAHVIDTFGTPEQIKNFCGPMYAGKWGGTMCLTEPQAGSAVGDAKTSAHLNADGTYSIKGNKIFISSGDHDITENIVHLVLARVEGDPAGTRGLSLFIVPKIWVKPDGSLGEANDVECVNVEHKMGLKGSATCSLNFGEKGHCRGYLVGERSKGITHMFQLMNEARLMVGMQGVAVGASAYESAAIYAKERVQAGKTIIDYPDVRRSLMLSRALVEGMRALLLYTSHQADVARHHGDEEIRKKQKGRVDLLIPICKAYCSDWGFKVTELAMQVYGGYGYISEYPVEQSMRDVKIASIYEGTNGIQALDLLARKLPLNGGELFRELYEEVSGDVTAWENDAQLGESAKSLKKALDAVAEVAMKVAEWGMSGDRVQPQLAATPFLEMCGHVVLSWLLLKQAALAASKSKDDSFYTNKIVTARFFAAEFLPLVIARRKSILTTGTLAMEASF